MDFSIISRMADAGFLFAPAPMGMTRSDRLAWQDIATNAQATLRQWVSDGDNLVAVAKHGHGFAVDADDTAALKAMGFDFGWLDGCYLVDTPSGGLHAHGLNDAETEALGNLAVVHAEKGNRKSKKVLELKLHNQSVAAPTAIRLRQPGKVDGEYLPRGDFNGARTGLPPAMLGWVRGHAGEPRPACETSRTTFEFHPGFDLEEFLENEGCTETQSGWVGESLHVEVESCPHCGKEARGSTVAAGVTKFIFSGTGYGFICHACGVDTREGHERLMEEDDPRYEPWRSFIYRHDDDGLLLADGAKAGLDVVTVGQEPEAVADGRDAGPRLSAEDPEGKPQDGDAPEFSDDEIYQAVHNAIYWTDDDGKEHAKREREVRLEATKALYSALQSKGRGLIAATNGSFMCRSPRTGRLMDLDGREFRDCLFGWDLPESHTADAVVEGLKNRAIALTRSVDVYPLWHYDPERHTLYANIENTSLCAITPEGWRLERNGHGGVWVHSLSGGLPKACLEHIARWEGSGLEIRDTTLCNLLRMKYEAEEGIRQEDMEWLFLARLLVGCLPEMAEYRNLCVAVSDRHSSGKTTLFSYPGWLFEGKEFYPTALAVKKDSDQLETLMTQKAILLADNVDRASEMSQHILCMAATTGKASKRAHYRNFELAEARFRADVYMTALQLPRGFKGDVYSRLLIFKLAVQEQDGLTETERKRRFLERRTEMLGEILGRLQAVVRDEAAIERSGKGLAYRTEFRIKDFGLFLLRQEGLYGRAERASRLLEALTDQQRESCVEASAIEAPLDFIVGALNCQGRRFSHNELYKEMARIHRSHVDRDGRFYFADARGLKSYLMPNQELLRKRWGLVWERTGRNHYWRFKPTRQQIADARERAGLGCETGMEDAWRTAEPPGDSGDLRG